MKLAAEATSEKATILDKKDEVIATVAAHKAKAVADVEKGLAEQQAKADKKAAKTN